jgi:hypothetical protein
MTRWLVMIAALVSTIALYRFFDLDPRPWLVLLLGAGALIAMYALRRHRPRT